MKNLIRLYRYKSEKFNFLLFAFSSLFFSHQTNRDGANNSVKIHIKDISHEKKKKNVTGIYALK